MSFGFRPTPLALASEKIRRTSVEFTVVDHCNLACVGCDHGSPFERPRFASLAEFITDLKALESVISCCTIKLLGGEPFLHPNLVEFVVGAKSSVLADQVEIWTNGTLLHKADPATLDAADSLVVTKYPGVNLKLDDRGIRLLAEKHCFRLDIYECSEFIDCFAKSYRQDRKQTAEIFAACKNTGEWSCHSFRDGRYYKCSRANYIRNKHLHETQAPDWSGDWVNLHQSNLAERLSEYLASQKPPHACGWCLGTSGEMFPHRQENRIDRAKSRLGLI